MDVLAEALRLTGARGAVGVRLEAGETWGQWLDSYPGAALHVVTQGSAWLHRPGDPPAPIGEGDAVLLAPGTPHGLAGDPGATMGPCDGGAARSARAAGMPLRLGMPPVRTEMITLHYDQDPAVRTPVLTVATGPMHVAAGDSRQFTRTVELLTAELEEPQLGTTSVVTSIVNVLLVQFLRAWLARHPRQRSGSWLAAMRNPVVRDALTRVHREPHHPWTTDTLAAAVSVSRATLDRHFRNALGQSPGAYVTQWRMDLASVRLRDTDDPVESISAAVGYGSPHAFSRAFRRARSMAPGEYRALLRSGAPARPAEA
ncbi:AraC family transcriptional regulator [Pseudosporangium ferrugineum]|uniref:AraC family transcriptional regulator n=1 Tax=Pseudosporangium ferrugineum TaxID=439699 RepID=A0A2T0SF72_9ACTN|nr:AraC family transcriptional regulator [Pseudosporangium ferrugineum]PRY32065.1 AraC family transcriptional regulator [Pseudosporangium ferrugineum]